MAPLRSAEAWTLVVGLVGVLGLGPSVARPNEAPVGRTTVLTGIVVRPDGQTVRGAEVYAATCEDDHREPDGPPLPGWQGRTNATGQFQLDLPEPSGEPSKVAVWAYQPGQGLAWTSVVPARRSAAEPIRLCLTPLPSPATAGVRVVGPQGAPLPGVRVRPTLWYDGALAADSTRQTRLPAALADRLAVVTDAQGRATFADLAALHLAGVATRSPHATVEQFAGWEPGWDARARGVRLREVGQVEGQIRGEDDRPRTGWIVAVRTWSEGQVVALGTTTTDPSGRFALAGLALGSVEVRVEPPPGGNEVSVRTRTQPLRAAGQTAVVAIQVRRGVRVAGRVVDSRSGGPIAGARVALGSPDASEHRVASDSDGRFATILPAPPNRVWIESAPEPYLTPLVQAGDPSRLGLAQPGPDGLVLTLERGLMLVGTVDRPPGAGPEFGGALVVRARWDEHDSHGRAHAARSVVAEVRPDGRFTVGPVSPDAAVALRAESVGDEAPGPERLVPHPDQSPIPLAPPNALRDSSLVGRVVDTEGRPVVGVLIQFRVGPPGLDSRADLGFRTHRVTTDGLDAVVTDAAGQFHSTSRRAGGLRVAGRWLAAVETEAGGGHSVVGEPGAGGEVTFPPIVLTRGDDPAPLIGRVVGNDGRAIVGATVRDLAGHRTTTDEQGQFHLERTCQPPEVPSILVVESDHYRCSGSVLRGGEARAAEPLVVTLSRLDEPTPARIDPPAAQSFEGVREAELQRVLDRRDPIATAALLEHLAETDPQQAGDLLRAGTIADLRVADGLRASVARHLVPSHGPDAAEALLRLIANPEVRTRAHLAVIAAASLPVDAKELLVAQAENQARLIGDLRTRVVALGEVVTAWLDLDRADRARTLFLEAEAGADRLPRTTTGAAAWTGLAPALARLDPAQAHARLDAVVDLRLADRGRLATARALVRSNPSEAVRFFGEVRDRRLAGGAVAEIAHAMASSDPALARVLVDSVRESSPVEAAHGLGMLAHALAPTNRSEALALLRLAFDRLASAAHAGQVANSLTHPTEPAHVASALLLAVEAVDPGLIPEFAWRAVALHDARPSCDPARPARHRSTAIMAALLHPYDPNLAAGLFDPTRLDPETISATDFPPLLLATTRLAPHLASRWAAAAHLAQRDHHLALLVAALAPSRTAQETLNARHLLQLWSPASSPTRP